MEREPGLRFSISYTTRQKRPAETHGRDYFFVSRDEFKRMVAAGDFLEHARVFAFTVGGQTRYWIGSADMMARNLDNRVELVAPVDDPLACEEIQALIDVQLSDTALAWELGPDAVWRRIEPAAGQEPLNSQDALMEHASQVARPG